MLTTEAILTRAHALSDTGTDPTLQDVALAAVRLHEEYLDQVIDGTDREWRGDGDYFGEEAM